MDIDLKKRWVAALRSGKYKQGKGSLVEEFKGEKLYCCLGVLGKIENFESKSLAFLRGDKYGAEFLDIDVQEALSSMNDAGVPFPEIADHIEKHL